MKHILLAEDDIDYAGILKQYLELSGFQVTWAKDGAEAFVIVGPAQPDICVLDVMMPEMDGFTLAEKIAGLYPDIPIIFLTAKGMKEDKIRGLKLGADDYMVKPFEADELVLRIKNILKRSQKGVIEPTQEQVAMGQYVFNPGNYTLVYKTEVFRLTEKEASLLAYLHAHRNSMIKRDDILMAVWGSTDFFSGRSMDVFISRLRKYFVHDNSISIVAYRGLGLEFNIAAH